MHLRSDKRAATVPCAQASESANGTAVGLPHLQPATVDRLIEKNAPSTPFSGFFTASGQG